MNELIENPGARPRIVIAGAGYAGYHCARCLERLLPREAAEIVIVSPTDYMPYTSLLPQVGAGTVDPRHIAVSLSATLRRTRHVPGHAAGVDLGNRSITVEGPDGQRRELSWDGSQPAAHPHIRPPRQHPHPRLPPLRPARQQAAGRHRLVQQHHRTPPVRPARPDPQRKLRSHRSRAHRHLLPNRRTAPQPQPSY